MQNIPTHIPTSVFIQIDRLGCLKHNVLLQEVKQDLERWSHVQASLLRKTTDSSSMFLIEYLFHSKFRFLYQVQLKWQKCFFIVLSQLLSLTSYSYNGELADKDILEDIVKSEQQAITVQLFIQKCGMKIHIYNRMKLEMERQQILWFQY